MAQLSGGAYQDSIPSETLKLREIVQCLVIFSAVIIMFYWSS